MTSRIQSLAGLFVFALVCLFFSLVKGSTSLSYDQVFAALLGHGEAFSHDIIWKLRLPRTFAAFITGGLLALAGTLMQVLLRNPLADPYVLGISGGAALGALSAILLGLSGTFVIGGAWLGALLTIGLTLSLVKGRIWQASRLLLTGVSLACGFSALISLLIFHAPAQVLHSLLFWLLGDLSANTFPWLEGGFLLLSLSLTLRLAPALNILSRGEQQAAALGVDTRRLQLLLYLLSSLLTACAVALAGCIGFIGLITPHLLRLLLGSDHRLLLPASVLLGGSLLTLADLLARTLMAPQQLPVGIVMALLGIPIFLILLEKRSYT